MQTADWAAEPIELKDRRVLVVGLGESGCAAAEFLHTQGAVVSATDQAPPERLLEATRRLEPLGVALAVGILTTTDRPSSSRWAKKILLMRPATRSCWFT